LTSVGTTSTPVGGKSGTQRSIATKILLYILLFSSFITLLLTFFQLYTDYREQTSMVDQRMRQIELSYRESLGNAIWYLNTKQVENILLGITRFEDVHYAAVQFQEGERFEQGTRSQQRSSRQFEVEVEHTTQGKTGVVGHLSIESNLDGVFRRLSNKFWLLLASQGLKTFIVSMFILFIIHYLVTRHMRAISDFAGALDISQRDTFLQLDRPVTTQSDELDQITDAINQMKHDLIEDAEEKARSELNLRKVSQAVEHSTASILILDAEGHIEYANPRFESNTGFSLSDVAGQQSNVLCFGDKKKKEYQNIWRIIEAGEEWRGDLLSKRKDGTRFWEAASVSSIRGPTQDITHYVILKDDISELRKLKEQLELERDYLREEVNTTGKFGEIIGDSRALKRTLAQVEAVAQTPASVLILGESGVGKEMIARAIHNRSDRVEQPMVKVNCASIPGELFESEFFGHVKGSFTGAQADRIGRLQLADGGTLFLDEVGEIPLAQQGKLLRALQEGEFERIGDNNTIHVDVRVVAATNRNLEAEIKAGRFREDLFYRLNVFPVEVPPLRDRIEDVVALAVGFLESACQELNREPLPLSQSQIAMLKAHSWPGNIRELKNTIERAVISSNNGKLKLDISMVASTEPMKGSHEQPRLPATGYLTQEEFKELEKNNIIAALRHANWKTWGDSGAAALLGIKPSTLAYQMKTLGIKKP
jgi:PAS domain S-box-containing protein